MKLRTSDQKENPNRWIECGEGNLTFSVRVLVGSFSTLEEAREARDKAHAAVAGLRPNLN